MKLKNPLPSKKSIAQLSIGLLTGYFMTKSLKFSLLIWLFLSGLAVGHCITKYPITIDIGGQIFATDD